MSLRIAIIDASNPDPALVKAAGKERFGWGEIVEDCKVYPCHDGQLDVLDACTPKAPNSPAPFRYTFAFAGTGGGKSTLIPLYFLRLITLYGGKGRYLLVIPDYAKLDQSTILDEIKAVFGDGPFGDMKYAKDGHKFTCRSGATILVRSSTEPDKIEGGQYLGIALDEVKEISKKAWENTRARGNAKRVPILGVTTPDSNSWYYDEIYKPCTNIRHLPVRKDIADACEELGYDPKKYNVKRWSSDREYFVRQWPSILNPTYSVEAFKQESRVMAKALYERKYFGGFASIDGLIYETFADNVVETLKALPSPAVGVAMSIDWGWQDPTAILVGIECQDSAIYIVDEFYANKVPTERIKHIIKGFKDKWIPETMRHLDLGLFCDSSRPETINDLNRNGIQARRKKIPLIATGIRMVDTRLRAGYLKVYDTCRHLIEESGQYVRAHDREGDLTKPIDKHNHAMDALRYLITGMDYGRRLEFEKRTEEQKTADQKALEETKRLERVGIDPIQLKEKAEQEQKLRHQRLLQAAWVQGFD